VSTPRHEGRSSLRLASVTMAESEQAEGSLRASGPVPGGRPLRGARLIGLTGGIACGKSAISRSLASRGAVIVDADLIAREVVAPHSEGLKLLVARWGKDLLTAEGALDRAKLGAIVFSDPGARATLDKLLHPLIATESARQVQSALQRVPRVPLVVYDAALLIEAGRAEQFRPLIVVYSDRERQIERVTQRDQLSYEEATRRVDAQMPALDKAKRADWLIVNHGEGLHSLEPAVDALWGSLTSS